ncbi:MAG: PqqD family protein [Alphaproteobacteria bacterium]|jgi:hypothetical protein|nr:PqqD family protein [Alphaproteobacteria bacterium]|tara:strand:+ start:586 stop:861 length:276 start_codon:yes stop_codon:yes gene_type:complete
MENELWRLKDRVRLEGDESETGGVLYDTYTATMYSCNHTAWSVLQRLAAPADLEELSTDVVKQFDVAQEKAQDDVLLLMRQLQSMDLLDFG